MRVRHTTDPGARLLRLHDEQLVVLRANSYAYDLLARELERYLRSDILGKSFLVSGHRGAGKTTLVRYVLLDTFLRSDMSDELARPLVVELNAPELLGGAPRDGSEQANDDNAARTRLERSLQIVTQALCRAMTEAVYEAFWRHVQRNPNDPDLADLMELAGQLRIELDGVPRPGLLREFWARVDGLEHGVIGRPGADREQGIRELVALSSAAQAFMVVSAKDVNQTRKEEEVDARSAERKVESTSTVDPKQITDALITPLVATIVGVGFYLTDVWKAVAAGIVALIVALFARRTVTRSESHSRESTVTETHEYIRDYTLQTLDRELPNLIDRIKKANLAPIFVVDEMDKLANPEMSVRQFILHFKHLAVEKSFFCFLCDRDYYEYIDQKIKKDRYPVEHTFFSHRLFITYTGANLRHYLVANPVTFKDDPQQPLNDGVGSRTDESLITHDPVVEGRLAANLSFYLLHKAQMHITDVRRELARLTDLNGDIRYPAFDAGFRAAVMIQLAIELCLLDEALHSRTVDDAYFRQITYDVLYWPSRLWMQGQHRFEFDELKLKDYVAEQMGTIGDADEVNPPAKPTAVDAEAAANGHRVNQIISDPDVSLLMASLDRLLDYLCDFEKIETDMLAKTAPVALSTVQEMLSELMSTDEPEALRVMKREDAEEADGKEPAYVWLYNHQGGQKNFSPKHRDMEIAKNLVDELEKMLGGIDA